MNFEELSSRLKKALVLDDSPVGVKLIKVGEDLSGIAEQAEPMSYCASVVRARNGESVLLGKDKHSCQLGAAILGLINMPGKISSGEVHSKARICSSGFQLSFVDEKG